MVVTPKDLGAQVTCPIFLVGGQRPTCSSTIYSDKIFLDTSLQIGKEIQKESRFDHSLSYSWYLTVSWAWQLGSCLCASCWQKPWAGLLGGEYEVNSSKGKDAV